MKKDTTHTTLASGIRLSKASLQVKTLGSIDELNSWLGFALAACEDPSINDELLTLQSDLFYLGAHPSLAGSTHQLAQGLLDAKLERLSQSIELLQPSLVPLHSFIYPGGSELAARIQLARCAARRAERHLVQLHEHTAVDGRLLEYFNDLSNYLFLLARKANQRAAYTERSWSLSSIV